MFDAAELIGAALRAVHKRDAEALKEHGIDFNPSFILGGQIKGEAPRLFNIYAAGNFIEASIDTPYFQIGEAKYGKPIIDRVITRSSSIAEATKCALISMDSTIRSNLSVGPPLDLLCLKRDALRVLMHRSIAADDEYFRMIRSSWGESLRHAFHALPNPVL
jgi:putative proteasome-type protease